MDMTPHILSLPICLREETSHIMKGSNRGMYKAIPLTVDGETKTGREWSIHLGYSINFINTYRRKHGEEETIRFIKENNTPEALEQRASFNEKRMPQMYPYGRIQDYDISQVFAAMVKRCYAPHHEKYEAYGVRGITVCQEWLEHPEKYEAWAVKNGYEKGLTMDRVDPDKGYSPDNCRFLTREENSKWKRNTHTITVNGITDSARGWDKRLGLPSCKINNTIRSKGMDAAIELIQLALQKAA